MHIQESIISNIPKLFDSIKKDIYSDSEIYEFIADKQNLDEMIKRQEELLNLYLKNFQDGNFDESLCYQFYKDFDIPYAIVFKSLKLLKNDLIRLLLKEGFEKEITIDVDRYISDLINMVSKAYIKRDIHKLKSVRKSKFSNYLLFKSHEKWLKDVIVSVENGDMDSYPIMSDKECEFTSLMEHPESLMVCMDANLCTYLKDIHKLLHVSANTFYKFYQRGEFAQAYLMFKDIAENSYKFTSTLKDLYYITFADLEGSFLKLVEMLTYSTKKQIITLIDIKNVRKLNSLYGEDSVNLLLEQIEGKIKREVLRYDSSTLAIRGVTSNFYMLNLNWDKQHYKEFLHNTLSNIEKKYKINDKNIEVDFTVSSFELEPGIRYHRDELIRIMLYLKSKSKEIDGIYEVFDEKEKDSIRKWLNERYYNINFVTKKLDNEDIQMVYQPIISLKEHKVVGVEALARIEDNGKLISAGLFIDVIYEMGKITFLDNLTLDKIAHKKSRLLTICDKVFINTASDSITNKEYQKKLKNFIEEFGVENVIIEITEQQALKDIHVVKELHNDIKIQFAIDDFGSGYSALKTVADLAIDGVIEVLKIDGELIKNIDKEPHTKKIVEVIVNLCKTLNIKSLAEFVENEESIKILNELGVDYLQGYYFLPPVKLDELLDYDLPSPIVF